MKRIVLWGLSTLSALVVLFGYHTSTSSVLASSGTGATFTGSLQGQSTSGGATSGAGGTPPPGSSSGGTGSGGAGSSDGSGSSGTTTVTGDAVRTAYGPVQVQLAMQGSTITHVTVLQYPSGNSRDQEINSYALPQLIQETLDAQNGSISMISGATYTSEGYLQSLQSALDQAGA